MHVLTKDIISLLSRLKETDIYKNSNLLGQKPKFTPGSMNNSDLLYALLYHLEEKLDKLNPKTNELIELEFSIKTNDKKETDIEKYEVFEIPEDFFDELKNKPT